MLPRWLVLALTWVLMVAGCGPGGPSRYHVTGRVTFNDAPVPAGTIIFEPDVSKGNDGPQGFAPIVNGSFDTARDGRATVGGPHRVTILGCDGVNVSETSPQGRPLFEPFSGDADLPCENTRRDFAVPGPRTGKSK